MSAEGESADGDGVSDTPDDRWWLTNDLLTIVLNVGLVGLLYGGALDVADLGAIPALAWTAFIALILGANVWAFGPPAMKAWQEVRGGDA